MCNLIAQECDGKFATEAVFEGFGYGVGPGPELPPGSTTYNFGSIGGGNYVVTNTTGLNGGLWHKAEDHTPYDLNGYCLLFDASSITGVFYKALYENICPNTRYTFSFYAANIVRPYACGGTSKEPNLKYTILNPSDTSILATANTGRISTTEQMTWNQYSVSFVTGQSQQAVLLEIANLVSGGCGNDFAMDDFSLHYCNSGKEMQFELCDLPGNMLEIGSETYTSAGNYEAVIDIPNTCNDSIVLLTLTKSIEVINQTTNNVFLARGETIDINGTLYSGDTIVVDSVPGIDDCKLDIITYVIESSDQCKTSTFPNAFSPNSDGLNDDYIPYLSDCVEEVLTFQIFDRCGNLIHNQNNIPPDYTKWDGFYQSKAVSIGVYVYILIARDLNGERTVYRGDITLLR